MGITKYCYAALFLKVRFEERKKWKNVSTGAVVLGFKETDSKFLRSVWMKKDCFQLSSYYVW